MLAVLGPLDPEVYVPIAVALVAALGAVWTYARSTDRARREDDKEQWEAIRAVTTAVADLTQKISVAGVKQAALLAAIQQELVDIRRGDKG